MNIDVLFTDIVAPHTYETGMLKRMGMGGTEATVIRIAEGLCRLGFKVASHQPALRAPIIGEYAWFLDSESAEKMEPRHVVHLRRLNDGALVRWPNVKHYLWLHDVSGEYEQSIKDKVDALNIKVICVSKWHRDQTSKYLKRPHYIYNPVNDPLYEVGKKITRYRADKIVWLSSPHKGLEEALTYLRYLPEHIQLHVYNPGYAQMRAGLLSGHPRVVLKGCMAWQEMMIDASDALCLFYPSKYPETFGLVAAEMNCLQIPVAGFKHAALKETANHGKHLLELGDREGMIELVKDWHFNGRPQVYGNDQFRLSHVLKEWATLFQ